MSGVEFQTEAREKRNSWKAAPTWLNVLWFLNVALYPCGIIGFFLPRPAPHTQIGRDLATPEARTATLIGLLLGLAAAIWMWFRLRSESGPAAKGAPWGVVAFVLFGWAYGVELFLRSIVNMFAYAESWQVWLAGAMALSMLSMIAAYLLERRRRVGIVLTAAYWLGGCVEVFLRSFFLGEVPVAGKIFACSFSVAVTVIILVCLFRPQVREWAAY